MRSKAFRSSLNKKSTWSHLELPLVGCLKIEIKAPNLKDSVMKISYDRFGFIRNCETVSIDNYYLYNITVTYDGGMIDFISGKELSLYDVEGLFSGDFNKALRALQNIKDTREAHLSSINNVVDMLIMGHQNDIAVQ